MIGEQVSLGRRGFLLGAAGLVGAPLWGFGCEQGVAPSKGSPVTAPRVRALERITLGFIGMGEEGTEKNLEAFLRQPDVEVVGVCDVDRLRARAARLRVEQYYAGQSKSGVYAGCMETQDWREIVGRPDVDAVVVSTPDHWHVPLSLAAIRSGKDVFCEKPYSLCIGEGRVLCAAAERAGAIHLTASEARATLSFYQAAALARSGMLGRLRAIQIQIYRGYGEEERVPPPIAVRAEPVPEDFDYEMWLGPAPEAPYMKARCHGSFRYNLDYAGGNMTDWGFHLLDVAQWGNDTETTGPVWVSGSAVYPEWGLFNAATDWDVRMGFANGVELHFASGGLGIRFEGEAGWVRADFGGIETSSRALARAAEHELNAGIRFFAEGEHRNFLDAVKTRRAPYLPPETAHRSVSLGHLAQIAGTLRRRLTWDPVLERFPEDEEANRMLHRAMRSPWTLEV